VDEHALGEGKIERPFAVDRIEDGAANDIGDAEFFRLFRRNGVDFVAAKGKAGIDAMQRLKIEADVATELDDRFYAGSGFQDLREESHVRKDDLLALVPFHIAETEFPRPKIFLFGMIVIALPPVRGRIRCAAFHPPAESQPPSSNLDGNSFPDF
jgi:hypothetical protein